MKNNPRNDCKKNDVTRNEDSSRAFYIPLLALKTVSITAFQERMYQHPVEG
jgi:hypothetical protein